MLLFFFVFFFFFVFVFVFVLFCFVFYQKGNNSKMGDNSDKKKIRVTYFFFRNPKMNFQNISIHAMHMKATRLNSQKLLRARTPSKFHSTG